MSQRLLHSRGFTLVELILVIVIIGILVGVAVQNGGQLFEMAKIEQTKQEMDALAVAITGNAELENNGVRTDFGYVGDVGSMPPNLDALYTNPGSYATWNGPYIGNRFTQVTDDYKKDAYGTDYAYSGGATIISTGSGSNIVRRVANSTDDMLLNNLSGNVVDRDGTPPGTIYDDSILVRITYPNGTGGTVTAGVTPDPGGYFEFDSLPIGNHDLQIIYQPNDDTLRRFVSVAPNSSIYGQYNLASDVWSDTSGGGGGGGLTLVPGLQFPHGGQCDHFHFTIENNSGADIDITSLTLTWSSPSGYFEKIKYEPAQDVYNEKTPRAGSGDLCTFSPSMTVSDGTQVEMKVEKFNTDLSGPGTKLAVDNTTFTVTLSDGSDFDIVLGDCE